MFVPVVYMTSFPPFGGGVHSMVTSDCPIPWIVSLRRTLLGEPAESIDDSLDLEGENIIPSHFFGHWD